MMLHLSTTARVLMAQLLRAEADDAETFPPGMPVDDVAAGTAAQYAEWLRSLAGTLEEAGTVVVLDHATVAAADALPARDYDAGLRRRFDAIVRPLRDEQRRAEQNHDGQNAADQDDDHGHDG